jgi:hypothetical protein
MLDSRLFNQESLSGNFADDDAYSNLYDRLLFHGSINFDGFCCNLQSKRGIFQKVTGIHLVVALLWIMIGSIWVKQELGLKVQPIRRLRKGLYSSRSILEMYSA